MFKEAVRNFRSLQGSGKMWKALGRFRKMLGSHKPLGGSMILMEFP